LAANSLTLALVASEILASRQLTTLDTVETEIPSSFAIWLIVGE
jgi:hypothetical protein